MSFVEFIVETTTTTMDTLTAAITVSKYNMLHFIKMSTKLSVNRQRKLLIGSIVPAVSKQEEEEKKSYLDRNKQITLSDTGVVVAL